MAILIQVSRGHGDRSEHLDRLNAKIEADPGSVVLLLDRAEALRRLGHYDESLLDLDRILALSPGNRQVHYLRGLTHYDRRDFAKAEASLRRYIESEPDSPAALAALAKTLMMQGRHVEAGNTYTRAIAVQPTPVPDHFIARAKLFRAAGHPASCGTALHCQQLLELAIEGLDEGMSSMGPLVTLQRLAIEIELDGDNHAGAITRIDDVLAEAPRKETWLVRRGEILASAGHHEEAFDAFGLASAALESLPPRVRSSPAMIALRERIARHLDKDTSP